MKDVFTGKFVRLSAFDPEEMSKAFTRWNLNSEYARLLNSAAHRMQSAKAAARWMEKEAEEISPSGYYFSIRTLVAGGTACSSTAKRTRPTTKEKS